LPVTVASTLAMPGERLIHDLAQRLEIRAVGVNGQIRRAGVVQRQQAFRLDVQVRPPDLERPDVGGEL
jgi:hypothetical protein